MMSSTTNALIRDMCEECILREIREETGLAVTDLRLRGILTFILPAWGNELTFLYTARTESGDVPECSEGVLKWVPIKEIPKHIDSHQSIGAHHAIMIDKPFESPAG